MVEHTLHTGGVAGSIPAAPTILHHVLSERMARWLSHSRMRRLQWTPRIWPHRNQSAPGDVGCGSRFLGDAIQNGRRHDPLTQEGDIVLTLSRMALAAISSVWLATAANPALASEFGHTADVTTRIKSASATSAGILLWIDQKLMPDACTNANGQDAGRLMILLRKDDTPMIDLFLASWNNGKRRFRIRVTPYTQTPLANPYSPERGDNFCTAAQIDVL